MKTRRGLEGRVRDGRSGGGISYGYTVVQGDVGARLINAAEAEVVRRVFREYAAGVNPRAIARRLNAEGVPGPHGREWRDTAIRGHVLRGTGILNDELYVGRLVWNRLAYLKDPNSGRRRSRLNPDAAIVVTDVPELRIVDDALWQSVKSRQLQIREQRRDKPGTADPLLGEAPRETPFDRPSLLRLLRRPVRLNRPGLSRLLRGTRPRHLFEVGGASAGAPGRTGPAGAEAAFAGARASPRVRPGCQ